jgi:hypothetical protein
VTLTDRERKKRPCGACGEPVGLATIVCGGDYPDVPLCMDCGTRRPWDETVAAVARRSGDPPPEPTGL